MVGASWVVVIIAAVSVISEVKAGVIFVVVRSASVVVILGEIL